MSSRLRRRPSAAMVVALLALFVALDGPATAARLIDGGAIKRNSIGSTQIRNRSLGTQDLSKAAVKTLQATPSKSVDATKILAGAVGTRAIAPKAIDGTKLGDGVIGMSQLGAGAVTSSKIAGGAVGAGAVADGGLQTRDVGDFYGSVLVDFTPFAPNTCQVAKDIAPQPSAVGQANAIGDDVVSVSPGTTGWPDPIVITGYPGAGNTLRIVACRVGQDRSKNPGDPSDIIDPGPTTFQYVAFDSP
jgi:hypothetical protein